MTHTAIPEDELKVFDSLSGVFVVIDVGARDDVDYLNIKPWIELHAFEPYPPFFEELKQNAQGKGNVHLNNCALGEKESTQFYHVPSQSISGSASFSGETDTTVPVITLDSYVKEKGITRIDFLKIDTEGNELNVLLGAKESIPLCRYIQYETHTEPWNSQIKELLEKSGFTLRYTGYRNMIAVREGEPLPWIPTEPKEGNLTLKS